MKYAIIENGTVTNIAAATAPLADNWIEAGNAKIGESWNGTVFSKPAAPAPTSNDIKRERDRRLEADFAFMGKLYQRDPASLARITGAATLAGFAMGAGAQPGDYRWHGGETDFAWIASDDSLTLMDAQTAFAFGQLAANVETRTIFAAKALREMNPIPTDYADDRYWPDTRTAS